MPHLVVGGSHILWGLSHQNTLFNIVNAKLRNQESVDKAPAAIFDAIVNPRSKVLLVP